MPRRTETNGPRHNGDSGKHGTGVSYGLPAVPEAITERIRPERAAPALSLFSLWRSYDVLTA